MTSIYSDNIKKFLEELPTRKYCWEFANTSHDAIERYFNMATQAGRLKIRGLQAMMFYEPIRWFHGNSSYSPLICWSKHEQPTPVTGYNYLNFNEAKQIEQAGDGLYTVSLRDFIKNGMTDFTIEDQQVVMIRFGIIHKVMKIGNIKRLIETISNERTK